MRAKILYASNSGNTKRLAEMISEILTEMNVEVGIENVDTASTDIFTYDLLLFGSFTRGRGQTPTKMKEYIAKLGEKPKNVAIFGTGDTQWGDNYCGACERLGKFFETTYSIYKTEHYPEEIEREKIKRWTREIVQIEETNQSKSL